jgi:type VI secretion system ImpM family protein
MDTTGFFGKLPSHGDFVSRRLSRDFLDVWDGWLQHCMAESKATLGENWLNVFLTSPIWRFAMTPGACGDEAYIGVLTPSVDRVGRYFPLSIVASAPESAPPLPAGGTSATEHMLKRWYGGEPNRCTRWSKAASTVSPSPIRKAS